MAYGLFVAGTALCYVEHAVSYYVKLYFVSILKIVLSIYFRRFISMSHRVVAHFAGYAICSTDMFYVIYLATQFNI